MKTYNYTYYGTAIQKSRFEENVPKDWEDEYDDIKGYSYGGYDAVEVQKDEDDTQAIDLINWVELSRRIAGNETSISRNRIPKKYKKEVDAIISAMGNFLHNLSHVKIDFSKVENYEIAGIDTKDYPDESNY